MNHSQFILVAAGDYRITQAVMRALGNASVLIKGAFTHRDTMNMLQTQRFHLIVLDGSMFDRHTREFTIHALDRLKNPVPRLTVAQTPGVEKRVKDISTMILTHLDEEEIRQSVASILGTGIINREQQTRTLADQRQIEELRTLFRVSMLLTRVLDLPEVLNRVVEAARELTNAEEGFLLMPGRMPGGEGVEETLILKASSGMQIEPDEQFRARITTSAAGEVYTSGKPILSDGRDKTHKLSTSYLVGPILYVPIESQDKTIGVLGVNNHSPLMLFDDMHQDLLMNLSSYAAIAIENARIHEESLQRTRELELLVNASHIMNASLQMDDTFINICEQISTVIEAGKVTFYHSDDEDFLSRRAQYATAIWRPLKGAFTQISQGQLRVLLDSGAVWGEEDMQHTLSIPILSDGKFIGVLKACYITKPPVTPKTYIPEATVNALTAMAGLLTTATDTKHHRKEIAHRVNAINAILEADWSEIWLASNRNDAGLYLLAEVGSAAWQTPPYKHISRQHVPAIDKAITTGEVVVDTENPPRLIIPVASAGRVMGLILVTDSMPQREFTEREINMTKALAGQAAIALENARLHLDLAQNLAELKATQSKLAETVRYTAMGELAAIVAHQVNNPLTTIIVDSELLLMGEPPDTRRHKQLYAINTAGKRASEVAKRLLAMVRPADPQAEAELIDVVETVRGVLGLVGTHMERRNITLHIRLPSPDEKPFPPVLAIKGQLDDIWFNLITNAYEAMSDNTSPNPQLGVDAAYQPSQKRIIVRVWDTGPGMTEEVRQRIFAPFYTTKSHGTGLGLHICHQVVESLHGTIEVESVFGKGTRFTVSLPTFTAEELMQYQLKEGLN